MARTCASGLVGDALRAAARSPAPGGTECAALLGWLEAAAAVSHALRHEMARLELTEGGFRLLLCLATSGAVARHALAAAVELPASTVHATLGRLELSGLIVHERAERRAAAPVVSITPKGRDELQAMLAHASGLGRKLVSPLQPGELTLLQAASARLRRAADDLAGSSFHAT